MVRNKIISLLFIFSLFIMAGCEHNPEDDPQPEHLVTLSFSTMSMSGLLKSAATVEEDSIEKIILFGVNDQGAIIKKIIASTDTLSLSGSQFNLPKNVISLYAIANPSAAMELANPLNITDLMAMTGDFTNAPQFPFLMSCISAVNTTNVNLEFVRTVAKVNITGLTGFVIDSIRVMNTPSKGYVFDRVNMSVPVSSRISYSYPTGNPSIYIAESATQNPVEFFVKGKFQNVPDSLTYIIKSGGQIVDIVRNTYYQGSVGFVFGP